MNLLKRIWNYFFPEKKVKSGECGASPLLPIGIDCSKICNYCLGQKQMIFKGKMTNCPSCHGTGKHTIYFDEPELIEKEIQKKYETPPLCKKDKEPIYYFNSGKKSFCKSQLIGKVLTFGKERIRIHDRIPSLNKFKYTIEII